MPSASGRAGLTRQRDKLANETRGAAGGVGREPPEPAEGSVEDEIKQWLARELHDTVSSTLTTLLIQIQQLKLREEEPSETAGSCPTKAEVCAELEAFQAAARLALHHARRLVRELRRERRVPLTTFVASLRGMLDRFEERTGITCQVTAAEGWPAELGGEVAQHLVRITQEALQNVRCHSAASCVGVSLERAAGVVIVTISDDGIGLGEGPGNGGGFGLLGMRERAVLLGGDLRLRGAPGSGTMVQAIVPVERLR